MKITPIRLIVGLFLLAGLIFMAQLARGVPGAATAEPTPHIMGAPTPVTVEPTAETTVAPANTPAPVNTPAPTQPPAPTEAPAAPAEPMLSQGLGLPRDLWEAGRGGGAGTEDVSGFRRYADGVIVSFQDDVTGASTVWYLEREFPAPVSLDLARSFARPIIPADSELVETYEPRENRTGDLFASAWLKDRFADTMWTNAAPGQFLVLYRTDAQGNVTSFVITLGNNP